MAVCGERGALRAAERIASQREFFVWRNENNPKERQRLRIPTNPNRIDEELGSQVDVTV